jgi:hypothetical protein
LGNQPKSLPAERMTRSKKIEHDSPCVGSTRRMLRNPKRKVHGLAGRFAS